MIALVKKTPTAELPIAETVQVEPYELILKEIAADDFAGVERLWKRHRAELTEVQQYQIADQWKAGGQLATAASHWIGEHADHPPRGD